ncbi:MAG: PD40 domain-containing protein [Polyangiaceae bacterium]|nr:PD40 domain-containing protein [Polyangiaceae bacterium]
MADRAKPAHLVRRNWPTVLVPFALEVGFLAGCGSSHRDSHPSHGGASGDASSGAGGTALEGGFHNEAGDGSGGAATGGTLTTRAVEGGGSGVSSREGGGAIGEGRAPSAAETCDPQGDEISQARPCVDTCGNQRRDCTPEGVWSEWGPCQPRSLEECIPGSPDIVVSCGKCGTQVKRCLLDCTYYAGECDDAGGQCYPGEARVVRASCGPFQVRTQICGAGCRWETGPCEDQLAVDDVEVVITEVDPVEYDPLTAIPIGAAVERRTVLGAVVTDYLAEPTLALDGADATFANLARFSPDGRWLAYISDQGSFAIPEVFVVHLDTGSRYLAVSATPSQEVATYAWLPGETGLAVVGDFVENDRNDVMVTRFSGDAFAPPVRVSTHDPPVVIDVALMVPSWNGTYIAYGAARADGGRDLFVASTAGDKLPVRVNTGAIACGLRQDGSLGAVAANGGSAGALVSEADESSLGQGELNVDGVRWLGDDVLAFECSTDATSCLCVRAVSQQDEVLETGPLAVSAPIEPGAWGSSPLGTHLAYIEAAGLPCIATVVAGDLGRCEPLELAEEPGIGHPTRVEWDANGETLLAADGNTTPLWIRNRGTPSAPAWYAQSILPFSASDMILPEVPWAPDGSLRLQLRNLVVDLTSLAAGEVADVYPFRQYGLEACNVESGAVCGDPTCYTTCDDRGPRFGLWSPDGRSIAYRECDACQSSGSTRTAQWSLWVVEVEGARPTESTRRRIYEPPQTNRIAEYAWRPLLEPAGGGDGP